MPEFIDKQGRAIELEIDGDCAYARHNGNLVGDVITTGLREVDHPMPPDPAKITGWNVSAEYQGAGIATEMVRLLVEQLGVLAPGVHNIGIGDLNALTDEGEAITRHCQKLGYIYPFQDEKVQEEVWSDNEFEEENTSANQGK